ncbi:DUF395-domain-containing protein [Coprinellus micaceus]|uniref:DUF395-domain-containing protein n=1 Tax=Coprinellus micaceus TaxID=71717 RepID=A0A4Y7SXT0_COPMI|nr:DUF395-domain-containing protein [Coprinellus micaceus]
MSHPVPLQSFLGGLTIPLPVHALTLLNGNVFGISGFLHRAVKGNVEGAAGVAGLVLGGMLVAAIDGGVAPTSLPLPIIHVAISGFLVGLGTKLSNGCTSGHMICGLSRFSQRSLVATASFFTTGVITASLVHRDLPAVASVDWSLGANGAKYLAFQLFPFAASLALYALVRSSAPAPATPNAAGSKYYQPAKVLRTLGFVTTAVQFALALQLSNLTDPLRVVSFLLLPWHRAFDPSLAALAAGALPLAIGLWRYARGGEVPVCGGKWNIPKGGCIDWKLVTGAALFGVGWGLAGVCPGPGLVNIGRAVVAGGNITPFATYLIALVAGGLLV